MRRSLAILLVVFALGACSNRPSSYGRGTEAAFMEACTVREQQPRPLCSCIYERITQQVPYERYVELDKQMQSDDKFVPDDLVGIAADCSTRLASTTTSATTTTLPSPSGSSSGASSGASSSS